MQQALAPDKMRVAFLLGAGCPVSIRVPGSSSGTTVPLMPDIAALTKHVTEQIGKNPASKKVFDVVCSRATTKGCPPTVEDILSCVRTLHDVAGTAGIDGTSKEDLSKLDQTICSLVTEVVQARLPDVHSPYHRLASWVGGIRRPYPVEIFTPNYDLCMEQALEERTVPYFDGFVGSDRTFFDLTTIEQGTLPARWARLWKLHGSINWWRSASGEVQRRAKGSDPQDRQMIYPSHLKYDESRRMPYLAMLDRLRAFLTQGQAVLITCGYSFGDQHLNEIILQGLSGNPTAVCFGLLYGDRTTSAEAVRNAKVRSNLSILAADGAVLGTLEAAWESQEKASHSMHGVAVAQDELVGRTAAPKEQSKFLLGDFAAFGQFLATQLAPLDGLGGSTDAL